jgi:Carboxypeptidase regulatory-like domain/TonB dependent receptor
VTRFFRAALFAASLALCSLPAFAQTLGELTGIVSDPSGGGVAGATVVLTSTATNATHSSVTAEAGTYTFPSLPPGLYKLKVEHPGFKTAVTNDIDVQVQQTVRLDVTLQVGQVSESIEVAASADLLQSENATLGTVIENKAVVELPLNGRGYLGLVALSSNANTLAPASGQAGSRQGGDRAAQSISAAGQRIMFDYFTLDGANNTDPNFNTYIVLPSIDAIQEFKVQIGVYPAEFGHQATQINVLTKSGGNVYHGAMFEFFRNNVLDAVPYAFTSVHPSTSPFKWNDFGFELDGPVRIPKLFDGRNRLFFMANDEWKIQRQNSLSTFSVPTAAMFGGDFSGLGTIIYDPQSKNPFPGNVIPTSRLDPTSLKFLPYYNSATLPGLVNNYTQFNASPLNRNGFVARMDFVESSKSQWTGRYSWGDEDQANHGINITGTKIITNYDQYLVSNTRSISPTLVNEARYGYSRFFNSIGTTSAYTNNVVASIGVPNLNPGDPVTWGVPNISLNGDGFTGIGDSTDGPYANDNNTLQLIDNVSWVKGKHAFRFGVEYNRQNYNQVGNQFSRGNFVFQPNATQSTAHTGGDAFAEFLLGQMYQSTVAVAIADAKFQRNAEALFADDTWKFTSKITLSLGLRWELTPPFNNQLGNQFTVAIPQIAFYSNAPVSTYPYFVRQGNCTDPYSGINIRWTSTAATCSNGAYPSQLMQTQYKNFAPRVGVSWSPNAKLVVRAGFGIFFNQDIGNAVFDMARNIAARVTQTSTLGTSNLFYSNAVPGGNGTIAQVGPPYAYADALSHRTTSSMQYLLNVQREFAGNWVLEAGYLGSQSRHLYGFQDANQGIPGTVGSATSRLPFANYGVIQLVADGGVGNYNAFSFKATRRFSQGLSVIASYTYSKSLDDTSGIRVQGYDTLFPQNSNCRSCEKGLSSFDVRNRLVTSTLYELPVGKGKPVNINNGFLNGVIGGWQAGGIWTWQSGLPQTLSIGGVDNASTSDGGYDRPVSTGISPYLPNPSPGRWLNPAAYVEAPPGQFGNVGRNTVSTPGLFAIDFEIHKNFRMPYNESHSVQFRFEAFNATNHPNWSAPNGNILAGPVFPGQAGTTAHQGFGVISGTSTNMRQLQLALKYFF